MWIVCINMRMNSRVLIKEIEAAGCLERP